LADVAVRIDEQAKAKVAAAPPTGALSKRVPQGKRAVSVPALVPTGIARGDVVRVLAADLSVEGTVLAAKSSGAPEPGAGKSSLGGRQPTDDSSNTDPTGRDGESRENSGPRTDGGRTPSRNDPVTDGGEPLPTPPSATAPTTTGGEGRVTVAVDRAEATALLRAGRGRILVLSRGTRREYELTTLLRRAGKRFRKVSVVPGGPLDGHTLGEVRVRETYDVAVLAARHDSWIFAPDGSQHLSAEDELFIVGSRDAIDRFAEAAR